MIDERNSMDQRAPVTRRRLLTIAAAAAGCATIGLRPARAGAVASYTWHGVALGANASLTLQHTDESIAKAAIASCLEEVARLEAVFSLHRSDSALSQLNAQGTLTAAPHDLRRLLADALRLASQTAGRFDPTIQPLWQCYAEHFARNPQAAAGPAIAQLDAARALVDWRGAEMTGSAIRPARPGMSPPTPRNTPTPPTGSFCRSRRRTCKYRRGSGTSVGLSQWGSAEPIHRT